VPFHWSQSSDNIGVFPKLHPIPYIVHYFWPGPWSKEVHTRAVFTQAAQFWYFFSQIGLLTNQINWWENIWWNWSKVKNISEFGWLKNTAYVGNMGAFGKHTMYPFFLFPLFILVFARKMRLVLVGFQRICSRILSNNVWGLEFFIFSTGYKLPVPYK
jgi:hypothetical protein